MSSLRLGLREMRRSLGRFGLFALAVGLLSFLFVFQQALLDELVEQFSGGLRNQSADVLVYREDARRSIEASALAEERLDAIAQVAGVARVGPLGEGTFTVEVGEEVVDATIFGYELGGPGAPTRLVAGALPGRDGEAVASEADAGDGFGIGDRVRVVPEGPELEIVGLAAGLTVNVAPTLFTSFPTYQEARRAQNPDAEAVPPSVAAVEVGDADPDAVVAGIAGTSDDLDPLTREAAADEAPGVAEVRQSLGLVLLLVAIVVVLVVGFFFVILTVQKLGSLTVLRALGAPPWRLAGALVVQVLAVTVVGLAAGVGLSWLLLRADVGGIGARLHAATVAGTGLALVVLCLVASVPAVRRVLRVDPAEATLGSGLR